MMKKMKKTSQENVREDLHRIMYRKLEIMRLNLVRFSPVRFFKLTLDEENGDIPVLMVTFGASDTRIYWHDREDLYWVQSNIHQSHRSDFVHFGWMYLTGVLLFFQSYANGYQGWEDLLHESH